MKTISGFLGLIAVALGAFGAHALKPKLISLGTYETWSTAAHYNLVHAVALLVVTASAAFGKWQERIIGAWTIGVVLFSGSLYALALGAPKWLGPATPLGGMFLLAGWTFVVLSQISKTKPNP